MRASYTIYVCPECSEHHMYAGFCDICRERHRLTAVKVIPTPRIKEVETEMTDASSEIPKFYVQKFVDILLRSS